MVIKLAPLNVPMHRRRQTVGVLSWLLLLPISISLFLLCLYFTYTRALALAYLTWILFWDQSPETGGRRSSLIRRLKIWKWMRDFFPVVLVKEAELDPSRNYVFGYHPHGVISLGAWVNFATEANNFSGLFPGIHLRLLTLSSNFLLPFFREVILWLSIASVSRRSCEAVLNKGPGHSVCIVVGGAQESLYAKPGTLDLVLRKRLGFVKVAIKNSSSLVPVLSIGENEVYNLISTRKGSLAYTVQQSCKNAFGWTVPLFSGRGIFNYSVGVMPHRRQIATIVCKPIHPDEVMGHPINPEALTPEELNEITKKVHEAYIVSLMDAWEKYKDQYAPERIQELRLVE
ncbi:diacylglycerol acyltransferase [Catenaria anguillulae PL171]|uniref:Diacylglycerol O-acyltransferase n=1 Tax=Catenaria anguillulae PL171 TaxID=765915 RepID=A0A1Y2HZL3_9FUNG|nr:diacylglycerol acyltransferase [Catenaria anguillulae PL171]